jgi:choline dehydrogenase-like flavoprotein
LTIERQDASPYPDHRKLFGHRHRRPHTTIAYVPSQPYLILSLNPIIGGSVHPTSPSPFSSPYINPNLLASPIDLAIMRSAIRSARRFVSNSPSLQAWVSELVDTAQTDEELDAFIRDTGLTVSHCVGTSAMSPKGAKWGVVDPDLRVKGVKGVRIVDAGVLVGVFHFNVWRIKADVRFFKPVTPAGHSQAATYVVAERAADLIKAAWGA